MKEEYSLKISLSPHRHDNKEKPYYWCILCWEAEWHQVASGWESTPGECFSEAIRRFSLLASGHKLDFEARDTTTTQSS